jgi:hypothetical protein
LYVIENSKLVPGFNFHYNVNPTSPIKFSLSAGIDAYLDIKKKYTVTDVTLSGTNLNIDFSPNINSIWMTSNLGATVAYKKLGLFMNYKLPMKIDKLDNLSYELRLISFGLNYILSK